MYTYICVLTVSISTYPVGSTTSGGFHSCGITTSKCEWVTCRPQVHFSTACSCAQWISLFAAPVPCTADHAAPDFVSPPSNSPVYDVLPSPIVSSSFAVFHVCHDFTTSSRTTCIFALHPRRSIGRHWKRTCRLFGQCLDVRASSILPLRPHCVTPAPSSVTFYALRLLHSDKSSAVVQPLCLHRVQVPLVRRVQASHL